MNIFTPYKVLENIFSPPITGGGEAGNQESSLKKLITNEFLLDCQGMGMVKNKEIFKKYQRDANLGKSKHARILDEQVISHLVKYLKKDFDMITKDDLVDFFNAYDPLIHDSPSYPSFPKVAYSSDNLNVIVLQDQEEGPAYMWYINENHEKILIEVYFY